MEEFYKGQLVLVDRPIGKRVDINNKLKVIKTEDIIISKKENQFCNANEVLTGLEIPEISILTREREEAVIYRNRTPLNLQAFYFDTTLTAEFNKFLEYDELIECASLENLKQLKEYCELHPDIYSWRKELKSLLRINNNNPFKRYDYVPTSLELRNEVIKQLIKEHKVSNNLHNLV